MEHVDIDAANKMIRPVRFCGCDASASATREMLRNCVQVDGWSYVSIIDVPKMSETWKWTLTRKNIAIDRNRGSRGSRKVGQSVLRVRSASV